MQDRLLTMKVRDRSRLTIEVWQGERRKHLPFLQHCCVGNQGHGKHSDQEVKRAFHEWTDPLLRSDAATWQA